MRATYIAKNINEAEINAAFNGNSQSVPPLPKIAASDISTSNNTTGTPKYAIARSGNVEELKMPLIANFVIRNKL